MAYVKLVEGDYPDHTIALTKTKIVFGRHPDCDVPLASSAASRHHMMIVQDGTHYSVQDLDSSNGTYVNGNEVVARVRLNEGDRLEFADYEFVFVATSSRIEGKDTAYGMLAATVTDSDKLQLALSAGHNERET
ncbi:MAG: hypothetical protein CMJ78_21755 [Planctomycetaceae bacterium]|nr:hypothetical protein [Planctomycetaceae bacterium]